MSGTGGFFNNKRRVFKSLSIIPIHEHLALSLLQAQNQAFDDQVQNQNQGQMIAFTQLTPNPSSSIAAGGDFDNNSRVDSRSNCSSDSSDSQNQTKFQEIETSILPNVGAGIVDKDNGDDDEGQGTSGFIVADISLRQPDPIEHPDHDLSSSNLDENELNYSSPNPKFLNELNTSDLKVVNDNNSNSGKVKPSRKRTIADIFKDVTTANSMIKRQRMESLKNSTATTTVVTLENQEQERPKQEVKAQPSNEADIVKGFDIDDLKSRLPSSSNANVNTKTMFNSVVAGDSGVEKTTSKPVAQITKKKKGRGRGRPPKKTVVEDAPAVETPNVTSKKAATKQLQKQEPKQVEDSGNLTNPKTGLNFNKRLTRYKAKKLQEEKEKEKEKIAKEEEFKLQQKLEHTKKKKEEELTLKKQSNSKSQKVAKSTRKGKVENKIQIPVPLPANPPSNSNSEAAQPDKSEIQVPQSDPPEPEATHSTRVIPNHIMESDIIESSSQNIESSNPPPPPDALLNEKRLPINSHTVVESFNDTTTTTNDNDLFSNADFNNTTTTGIDQTTIHEFTQIESVGSKSITTDVAVAVTTTLAKNPDSAICGKPQQVETKHSENDGKQQSNTINEEGQQKVVETSKTETNTNTKSGKVSGKRKGGRVYKKLKRNTRSRTQRAAKMEIEKFKSVADNKTSNVEKETPAETTSDQTDKTTETGKSKTAIPKQKSISDPIPQPMTSNDLQENIPDSDPVEPLKSNKSPNWSIITNLFHLINHLH
ncbi:unnamed protein product [Ambrosiozyma monospora]|uniref:Unnamed protein product n=1 Tax=Ambrosiozyma monospora TaxID=43982 RepID=A0A9W7DKZ7_AMBMO|nr:unnamed protein product [Ambrosiozyma monospora]